MEDLRAKIQSEAIEKGLSCNNGTLVLPMRTGKCKVGLEIGQNYKKVLICYPNNPIKQSWIDDSIKFNLDISHFEFTTYLSLNKQDLSLYDLIILDEIDQCSIGNWEWLDYQVVNKLLGLTGTPPTGDKREFLDLKCPIVYEVKLSETVGKINKDFQVVVHLLNPSEEKDIKLKSGKFWSERAQISFWENKYLKDRSFQTMLTLMRTIKSSKTKFNYLKQLSSKIDRGLFFVELIDQCDRLDFPSYNSKNPDSEENLIKFNTGEINKLSCVGQLSAGVTLNNLDEVVLLHCYSSNTKSLQRLARCLNYEENKIATIHIIVLKNTRDMSWLSKGLEEIPKEKIIYKEIK